MPPCASICDGDGNGARWAFPFKAHKPASWRVAHHAHVLEISHEQNTYQLLPVRLFCVGYGKSQSAGRRGAKLE